MGKPRRFERQAAPSGRKARRQAEVEESSDRMLEDGYLSTRWVYL